MDYDNRTYLLFILITIVIVLLVVFSFSYRSKRRSLNLVRNVINSFSQPFYVINAKNHRIEFANHAALSDRLPIKNRCSTLHGKINKPCKGQGCNCSLENLYKTKEQYKTDDLEIEINGQVEYYELHGFPVFNKKGELIKVIEYNRDITPRRRAEIALEQSEKNLRNALVAKDKYFSILAHDVRNPFNFLIGISDLLRTGLDEISREELQLTLEKIHKTSIQTHRIFENLLFWAQAQTGEIRFVPRRLNIREMIEENVDYVRVFAEFKGVEIATAKLNGIYAFADENMIKTVLRNLMMNAIKFTAHGGKIMIDADQKDGMTEVRVSDTGVGIAEENINKLFSIEENFSTVGTANESGFGLGLVVSKEFIEMNKGRISVSSTQGVGSTFRFTLPNA
jgi:signal transduction histidine kinase